MLAISSEFKTPPAVAGETDEEAESEWAIGNNDHLSSWVEQDPIAVLNMIHTMRGIMELALPMIQASLAVEEKYYGRIDQVNSLEAQLEKANKQSQELANEVQVLTDKCGFAEDEPNNKPDKYPPSHHSDAQKVNQAPGPPGILRPQLTDAI